MIPDEAVEAAAVGISSALFRNEDWASLGEESRNQFRRDARAALEAAAPHLMAAASSAWHDAVSEVYVEGAISGAAADVLYARNPYRKADDARGPRPSSREPGPGR